MLARKMLAAIGLDWTDKYPSATGALANLNLKTAYIDGELCGVYEAGLPSFAHTQAATDGERDVHQGDAEQTPGPDHQIGRAHV